SAASASQGAADGADGPDGRVGGKGAARAERIANSSALCRRTAWRRPLLSRLAGRTRMPSPSAARVKPRRARSSSRSAAVTAPPNRPARPPLPPYLTVQTVRRPGFPRVLRTVLADGCPRKRRNRPPDRPPKPSAFPPKPAGPRVRRTVWTVRYGGRG